MFCFKDEEAPDSTLDCSIKIISEIASFLSVIFSIIVIVITKKKTKMIILNKLILQIMISEVLYGINLLLVIFDDAQGPKIFENYNSKTYICYTQIYISVFSCFWTLTASFFLSLKIYDMMVKKNKIFRNKIMEKSVTFFSVAIPFVLSYIFWLIQVIHQANKLNNLTKDLYYQKYHSHDHFRHMHCWFNESINYVIFSLCIILILSNFFLTIKGSSVINEMSDELKEKKDNYGTNKLQKKIDDVEHIKKSIWIYPITSGIIWLIFFILQILFSRKIRNPFLSWVYCIFISIRQSLYGIIFLYTQKDIRAQFIKTLLCKDKKRGGRRTVGIINEIKSEGKIMPDEEKI